MVESNIKAVLVLVPVPVPTGGAMVGSPMPGVSIWIMFADVKRTRIQNLLQLMRSFLMSSLGCRAQPWRRSTGTQAGRSDARGMWMHFARWKCPLLFLTKMRN